MNTSQPTTFSDYMRVWSNGILQPIAIRLHRLGVHPDVITVVGTLLVAVAALFIAGGNLLVGGVVVLIGLPFDALDGAVARLRDKERPFGAFLDSTLDRYADGFLFGALAWFGTTQDNEWIVLLSLATLIGAYLISYARARAESLGFDCKIGLFSRLERTIALLLLLFSGWVLPFLVVLAVGTHFTALQRIWHVHRQSLAD
jgi:CDP-diacylglycerol---glycerol-3-phosphate 3-phosphatidyltransferase